MWRQHDVFERTQGMIQCDRLRFEHIEACSGNEPTLQSGDQIALVDHSPAAGVDETRRRPHAPKEGGINHTPSLGAQGKVTRNIVRARCQVLESDRLDSRLSEHRRIDKGIVSDHFHVHCLRPYSQRSGNVPKGDQSQRLPMDLPHRRPDRLGRGPPLGPQHAIQLPDLLGTVEQKCQGMIGHFFDAKVRKVGRDHATIGGSVQIDGVHTDAVANNALELVSVGQHVPGIRLAATESHVGIANSLQDLFWRSALAK